MPTAHRYRELYEHEIDSNRKMLSMIESVPDGARTDPRFQQAVNLAAHLAACRENWLDRIQGGGDMQVPWFEAECSLASLRARFAALEAQWTGYLSELEEAHLGKDFDFPASNGRRFAVRIDHQLMQLVGHAAYHRGQVALLVDQLGGETVDTDYLYWVSPRGA